MITLTAEMVSHTALTAEMVSRTALTADFDDYTAATTTNGTPIGLLLALTTE